MTDVEHDGFKPEVGYCSVGSKRKGPPHSVAGP
jgi:hypothetical protein